MALMKVSPGKISFKMVLAAMLGMVLMLNCLPLSDGQVADRVKMLKLLLPDNISLSRFNSIITPMASTIISNQEENQKLASLRDTLLPKLMSGEIDVSNIQF